MEIFIDKENLLSYIHSAKLSPFDDCHRWLKNNADIYFRFSKEDVENNSDIKQWFVSMAQGRCRAKFEWNCRFPESPVKSNTHKSFERHQLSAMYFLDEEKIYTLKERGNILYIPKGEEINSISSLIFDDYQFTKSLNPRDFNSWEQLLHPMPCSDIIIADKYVLSSPELLESNIYKILEILTSSVKNSKVNIVIFTLKDKNLDCNKILNGIKKVVEKSVKQIPNVTIVTAHSLKDEHDRTIFTNYISYASGDTFNYYNSSGEIITRGRNYHIKSNAFISNLETSFSFIDDMQKIVSRLISENNENCVFGDKECNYIKLKDKE